MKPTAVSLLALFCALSPAGFGAADAGLEPFVAEYDVRYGAMTVGTNRIELSRSAGPGRWIMESRATASGLARLIAGDTLVQRSTFEVAPGGLRPLDYSFDDGTQRTSRDVRLEFDWSDDRVRGTAEDEPVDLAASPGLQDAASMQALVMARLRSGGEPGSIPMIEKDRIKMYRYTFLRRERLSTALGELDTVAYRSSREGSKRETVTWFAPELDYAAVRAEQYIDGKRRGFQTLIRAYESGG